MLGQSCRLRLMLITDPPPLSSTARPIGPPLITAIHCRVALHDVKPSMRRTNHEKWAEQAVMFKEPTVLNHSKTFHQTCWLTR